MQQGLRIGLHLRAGSGRILSFGQDRRDIVADDVVELAAFRELGLVMAADDALRDGGEGLEARLLGPFVEQRRVGRLAAAADEGCRRSRR